MGDIAKAIRSIGGTDLAGGGTYQGTRPQFVPKPPQGKKPAVVGRGRTPAGKSSGSESLTESAYEDRTFYSVRNVTSSDGVFVMQIRPVKRINFPNGVYIELKEPPA